MKSMSREEISSIYLDKIRQLKKDKDKKMRQNKVMGVHEGHLRVTDELIEL